MNKFSVEEIKAAIRRLLSRQRGAFNIRAKECHCRRKELMLSYLLDVEDLEPRQGTDRQECGYWCSACRFSNAGNRPVTPDGEKFEKLE